MFDSLNDDPGTGNLNTRAYFASLVGPRRIIHGRRAVKRVGGVKGVQLQKAGTRNGDECLYVECRLPPSVAAPVAFNFASQNDAIGETGVLSILSTSILAPLGADRFFATVLLPQEQLFAQLAALGGVPVPAGTLFPLVVSSVTF